MKTKIISSLTFSLLLIMCANACTAQGYETWVEKMTCGEAQYQLVSVCKKSNEELTLNDCKSQTLKITNKGKVRKVTLPELSKYNAHFYKNEQGNISELFVIQWGCGRSKEVSVLTLYYSIGGGSAPYSELFSTYDVNGKLIEDEKNHIYDKAIEDVEKHMKPVHSIMSE